MSIDMSNYDIKFFRGSNFDLEFSYTTAAGARIDLSGYSASMHIRRSKDSDTVIGQLTDNYPFGSFGRGLCGDFSPGKGFTGYTGGISLNHNGITGDIKIEIDSESSFGVPRGKHVYDLQLIESDKTQKTVLRGRLEVLETCTNTPRSAAGISGGGITGGSG